MLFVLPAYDLAVFVMIMVVYKEKLPFFTTDIYIIGIGYKSW